MARRLAEAGLWILGGALIGAGLYESPGVILFVVGAFLCAAGTEQRETHE